MMPTGRRRQITSSVKQLFQLSTMRILSRYESPSACSTAVFYIGTVYWNQTRLLIDIQKKKIVLNGINSFAMEISLQNSREIFAD